MFKNYSVYIQIKALAFILILIPLTKLQKLVHLLYFINLINNYTQIIIELRAFT